MTKLSKRLLAVTSYVELEDVLADIGCDHGLTSIFLCENYLCKKIICSDINENALQNAKDNIKKRNLKIETILSDGINNIDLEDINSLIITGMGAKTILHILEDDKKLTKINKLIIQSNNDYDILRQQLNNKGFYLENEIYTFDKGKWYITMKYLHNHKKNTSKEIKYGYLNNKAYNEYILNKQKEIFKKIPWFKISKRIKMYFDYQKLKKAIRQS